MFSHIIIWSQCSLKSELHPQFLISCYWGVLNNYCIGMYQLVYEFVENNLDLSPNHLSWYQTSQLQNLQWSSALFLQLKIVTKSWVLVTNMTIANSQGSSALFLQDGCVLLNCPMSRNIKRILSSSDGHENWNIISRHLS